MRVGDLLVSKGTYFRKGIALPIHKYSIIKIENNRIFMNIYENVSTGIPIGKIDLYFELIQDKRNRIIDSL